MNILVISNLFPPEVLGGYEILCQQVCQGLRFEGHRVTVLTTPSKIQDDRSWVVRGLRLFLPFEEPASGRYRLKQAAVFHHNRRVTSNLLKGLKPDVVFIWSQRRLTLASARACQELGIPTAYTFNDEYLEFYSPAPLTGKLSIDGLDLSRSTCISEKLKGNLLDKGLPVDSCQVIYQGIPLAKFPRRTDRIKTVEKFLYVGQLHPYKGVETAIEAAHLSASSLTIVGGGPSGYESRLKTLALGGPGQIEFVGKVPSDDVADYYRSHDALIFPSIWEEPFGLTHLEAMASGIPVISTINGGQGEFLEPGENCLAFYPGEAVELAVKMEELKNSPELAQRLADAGRRTVEKDFTLSAYRQKLVNFLKDAA